MQGPVVGGTEPPAISIEEGFAEVWSGRPDAPVQAREISDPRVEACPLEVRGMGSVTGQLAGTTGWAGELATDGLVVVVAAGYQVVAQLAVMVAAAMTASRPARFMASLSAALGPQGRQPTPSSASTHAWEPRRTGPGPALLARRALWVAGQCAAHRGGLM